MSRVSNAVAQANQTRNAKLYRLFLQHTLSIVVEEASSANAHGSKFAFSCTYIYKCISDYLSSFSLLNQWLLEVICFVPDPVLSFLSYMYSNWEKQPVSAVKGYVARLHSATAAH